MRRAARFFLAVGVLTLAFGQARAQFEEKKPGCGTFGTKVEFLSTPADAAREAQKQEKLVFVLHVSGHFEDPNLT